MANFLFVYRINNASYDNMSPEEMQQNMQRWQTWMSEGIQKGWLLDAGDGLKKEGRVLNAKKVVSDGPFTEAKEVVGGFSIVQAETLDDAAEFAKGCPVLVRSGTVEIRPLRGYNIGK
jgi:hypothetical protein